MNIDLNSLQQAIDTSWGRTSTPSVASFSIKASINQSHDLNISFTTIVNFGSKHEMIEMKKLHQADADQLIDKFVKSVKDRYKDIAGKSLKLSVDSDTIDDSFEIINLNVHNGKKTAYFRRKCIASIG